jgi:hypothetical protein
MQRNQALSPKTLAHALAVSESSVKPRVDDGALTATKTDSDHRRIAQPEAIRFLRASGAALVANDIPTPRAGRLAEGITTNP